MISLRCAALSLSLVGLVACGGSQKVTDVVAPQPAASASASPTTEANTASADAPAKQKDVEAEVDATGCKKDDDCSIFADCCSCRAVLASKPPPVPCESVCGESKCEVKEITIANVACEAGRCVIKKKK